MSVTIPRTVSSGFVTDPDQLLNEMLASVDAIGTSCEGVGVSPIDAPNDDTVWLVFEAAPDETAMDAVLAAHVAGTGDYVWPASIAATAGAWQDVIKIPVEPSSHVEVDLRAKIRIGDVTFSVSNLYFDNIARRRGVETVKIADALGLSNPYGDVPQYAFRLQPAGFSAQLQMRVQRTDTVFFESVKLEVKRKKVA